MTKPHRNIRRLQSENAKPRKPPAARPAHSGPPGKGPRRRRTSLGYGVSVAFLSSEAASWAAEKG